MSKYKNISRPSWIVVGIVAALVLVPTVAVATTSNVIIKNGTVAGQAGVTPAQQLLSTTASPNSFVQTDDTSVLTTTQPGTPMVVAPSTSAIVVTQLTIDFAFTGSASAQFGVLAGSSCPPTLVGSFLQDVNSPGLGLVTIPLDPGVAVPANDAFCGIASVSAVHARVSGYEVPSSEVSAEPLHPGTLKP
jgi:hypothetical protein